MSDDNTQGCAEPSPASAGSHVVAWAVFDGPDRMHLARDYGEAGSCADDIGGQIVPLYRHPTLTDEEREAIWTVAEAYADNDGDPECERIARIMQGLWQRTK